MVRFVSILVFLSSSLAYGQFPEYGQANPPQDQILVCPSISDDYSKMLSELAQLKASIRSEANCESITLQVKDLETLVMQDRAKVIDIIDNAAGGEVNSSEVEIVKKYAEDVTKKVASLGDLFSGNNSCFKDDQKDRRLTSLAGFVSEASSLVGSISGPWGAPIAIAGSIVSGFLNGLDAVAKTRAGFDFSDKEQWSNYVQSLCAYYNFKPEIDRMLSPNGHLEKLIQLRRGLDTQLAQLASRCKDCEQLQNRYLENKSLNSEEKMVLFSGQVEMANRQFLNPLGSYTLQNLGLRDWVTKEMIEVQKEAQSNWGDVSGRHVLSQAKKEIEDFLIDREASRFLSHQIKESRRSLAEFQQFSSEEGRLLYRSLTAASKDVVTLPVAQKGRFSYGDPLAYFRSLVLNPIRWNMLSDSAENEDIRYAWMFYRDNSIELFSSQQISSQVTRSFCNFFRHAGFYNRDIRETCRSRTFSELSKFEESIKDDIQNSPILKSNGFQPFDFNLQVEDQNYAPTRLDYLDTMIQSRVLK